MIVVRTVLWLLLILPASIACAQSPPPLPVPDLDIVVNGRVFAAVTQPDGSVVFGGQFSLVNGEPRSKIARLRPDGSLDPHWAPDIDPNNDHSFVNALLSDAEGSLYVAGGFSQINGVHRYGMVKLSGSGEGEVDPIWDPQLHGTIDAMVIGLDGAVFVGGQFNAMDIARSNLVKLLTDGTGAVDPGWAPQPDGRVKALAIGLDGSLYAGGDFLNVGGQPRRALAKLSPVGAGLADPQWALPVFGDIRSLSMSPMGELYIGGSFYRVGPSPRRNAARLASDTTTVDAAWIPDFDDAVAQLLPDAQGVVHARGDFMSVDGSPRNGVARLGANGALDHAWAPSVDAALHAMALSSRGTIYLGGEFQRVNGQSRLALAEIAGDGVVRPPLDAARPGEVTAVAVQPNGALIVAGLFDKVNDQPRGNLLRLHADGSIDLDWAPTANGAASQLVVDGNEHVYASGGFSAVNGVHRERLAKLSGGPGVAVLDPEWNPAPDDHVTTMALAPDGDLFVAGFFHHVGGRERPRLARLSRSGAGDASALWAPVLDSSDFILHADPSGMLYLGGTFHSINGVPMRNLARLSAFGAGELDTTWNPGPDGPISSIVSEGGDLIVGGGFQNIGGQAQRWIARLSTSGQGAADPGWDPQLVWPFRQMIADGDGSIFIVMGSNVGSTLSKIVVDGAGTVAQDWHQQLDRGVATLVVRDDGTVFAGGAFTRAGPHVRLGLAAWSNDANRVFVNGFESGEMRDE